MAKGYEEAARYAASVGAECVQVFAKSPRQWAGPPIDVAAAARFTALRAELDLYPLCTHTAYLLNLACADDALWHRSIEGLADELVRATQLEADYVVTHIGADAACDAPVAAIRVATAIDRAFSSAGIADEGPMLLLEDTAGAGRQFGGAFAEIGAVMAALSSARGRVGVCLDTCHAHAFGYDVTTREGWCTLAEEIAFTCGPDAVRVVHANDCVLPAGAKRDRHAWIGDGTIGVQGFSAMLHQAALASACVITEMPGEVPVKDETNLARLRELRDCTDG